MLDLLETYGDAVLPAHAQESMSHAIPRPGRALGTMIERLGLPVQAAVHEIQADLRSADLDLSWLCRDTNSGPGAKPEAWSVRASWIICAVALSHAAKYKRTNLQAAIRWFFSDNESQASQFSFLSENSRRAISLAVHKFSSPQEIIAFLPYVLESHGHVTRGRLERTATGSLTRDAKRGGGVFYTPADVAEFLISEMAKNSEGAESWCDPACGTGVFLRAALRKSIEANPGTDPFEVAIAQIFGMDVSALALEMAAFVLLAECLAADWARRQTPYELWRALRRNLVCIDAIQAMGDVNAVTTHFAARSGGQFDRLILNPPYGNQAVAPAYRRKWLTLSGAEGPTVPVQIPFVEMMWKLTTPNAVAAAVLPLSIAANTQKAHRVFREQLATFCGKKEFLFFDREPQSLFGEDVKTRNAILFVEKGREQGLSTSSLLKWTAPQRPQIFSRSRLVSLGAMELRSGIPRLGSNAEVGAYKKLRQSFQLARRQKIASLSYQALRSMPAEDQRRTLVFGATAYNYVNCFPSDVLAQFCEERYSGSKLHAVTFSSRELLLAAYAVFSSRLCFWVWRVEGDGFHLTREFLAGSPFWGAVESPLSDDMGELGGRLWKESKSTAVRSVNAGRVTYAFPPQFDSPDALRLEGLLLARFEVEQSFSEDLSRAISSTISIDGRRRCRAIGIT